MFRYYAIRGQTKLVDRNVKCCIESLSKCKFGYIKHQLYFCNNNMCYVPIFIINCPECFNKKEDNNSDFVPYSYKHLPKNTWNPKWIKVTINI